MNKKWIAKGALLCACALAAGALAGFAEEKRLGDYIYVPAMQVDQLGGSISLRVEGLALQSGSDEPSEVYALAGAEFGVYVFSSDGELIPWANPLYPSEQMRIRTGEGDTRFSLPWGAEYYLRQESAPQGYAYDPAALIPVTGEEIVVRNTMSGQLAVSAVDTLGMPVSGVQLQMTGDDGSVILLTTDENGQAVLTSDSEQGYFVSEAALPEGVFASLSVEGGAPADKGVYASVTPAHRTRVTFVHPASGSVQLFMRLNIIDGNAQIVSRPLEGVRMDIQSEPAVSVVTDDQGSANVSLLEGTYAVAFAYEGEEELILPVTEGMMVVESGATTIIELNAAQRTGRIVLLCSGGKRISSGSVTFENIQTGKTFGPYALDAEGMAVSDPLEAGEYCVREMDLGETAETGAISSGEAVSDNVSGLTLRVAEGEVTQATVELLTRERQKFALLASSIDDQGNTQLAAVEQDLELTLIGGEAGAGLQVDAVQGSAEIEALSGQYTLHMDEEVAQRLGVQPVSLPFSLPSEQESIVFPGDHTRILLTSVDHDGRPAAGAVYQLTDSLGMRYEIVCDEDGFAVSPQLAPGEVKIETLDAPSLHAPADTVYVQAVENQAARVQICHERYGSARISVRLKSLNENGEDVFTPLAGVSVRVYRMEEDGRIKDTGLTVVADDAGMAEISLEAGAYAADAVDGMLDEGFLAGETAQFSVANMTETEAELLFLDTLGGVSVQVTGGAPTPEELAQIRFELHGDNGTSAVLTARGGVFYAGGLEAGMYTLYQTQIPQGYTPARERLVAVSGGEVAHIDVPLEEYAVLSVSKTGLTFDNQMRTYVVPLSGQYGVFTLEDGEMKPYPDEEQQFTLWANVTPQEIAGGKADSVKLPAGLEGATYYLHEMSSAPGFAADGTYYEVFLRAGETGTVDCTVSSDRGFFRFDAVDALTGNHLPGGEYVLIDAESGETVLAFEMGNEAYQNAMAVPVGDYLLRQTKAGPGYALSEPAEVEISIDSYLSEGGTVSYARLVSEQIPEAAALELIEDVYIAQEHGLTLACVDAGALQANQRLLAPNLTIRAGAQGGERTDIASLVISGVGDAFGGSYMARVEYCLFGGGWQPSDARMTPVLSGPTAVSLDDVHDDISAVRITFIDAVTGEETVHAGFTPGQVTLNLEASAQGEVAMTVNAAFSGVFAYRTAFAEPVEYMQLEAQTQKDFAMQAERLFDTVSSGRDGKISGIAFFDEDADGVMDGSETCRYAGLTVSLQTADGDVVSTVRTGTDGRYAFEALSAGEYLVQFDAGDSVVFSSGSLLSSHAVSGVEDMRYGTSRQLTINGSHTDYLVHVGCIFAAEISGTIHERAEDGQQSGFAGLNVEMSVLNAQEDDEPLVTLTDGMGAFSFGRMLPGDYTIRIGVPDGYLCREAGETEKTVTLSAGESVSFGDLHLEKAGSISGMVRIDDDGDGVIEDGAKTLAGVRVVLLETDGLHTNPLAETETDADGAYVFDDLFAGDYVVLFELEGDWAFTRYGEDSGVFGAVSQSGATYPRTLAAGQHMTSVNAGVTIPAKLTVTAFKDEQADGLKGTYEPVLPGVSVSLVRIENGLDAEEITYVTGEDGTVTFDGVSPGEYVMAYRMPGQWRATRQPSSASANYPSTFVPQSMEVSGRSGTFTLGMGQRDVQLHIGARLSGALGGRVYYDDDADAKYDDDETFCSGVKVELRSLAGETLSEFVTDESGQYLFEGLAAGRYTVRFTAEDGCGFSGTERTAARGGVQESDKNVSSTRTIMVEAGKTASTSDAGVVRLASVSGRLWEDQSGDMRIQPEETAMSGLSVHLMDGAGRNILKSVQSDADGIFRFDSLKPGTYKIRVDAPAGYVFSGAMDGGVLPLDEERDGRGYSSPFTLLGGADVSEIGYGLLTQGVISGMIWEDNNYDGVMDANEAGLRGALVALIDKNGAEVARRTTIRSGEFVFDQLMPGSYSLRISLAEGYAFTADSAEPASVQTTQDVKTVDVGTLEMGATIADVRIGALQKAVIGGVVWHDSDDDGRRQTDDLGVEGVSVRLEMIGGRDTGKVMQTRTDATGAYRFDDVLPGDAVLIFEIQDGLAFARRVSGTRRVSSVPKSDSTLASTDEFTVKTGDVRTDIDVGVVGVGTVSGVVWEDSEYDGRRGAQEAGIADARADLVEKSTGAVAASAVTDESGAYMIDFARKGEYTVRITLPDGRIFTSGGAIAGLDSDIGDTEPFVLEMGESVHGLDVGAIVPACITGSVIVDENEDGVCGEAESGLPGAAVTVMQGGTVIATVSTDNSGRFTVPMLRPGAYRLRYALGEYTLFARGASLNMTNPDAGEAQTHELNLAMGQTIETAAVPVVHAAEVSGAAFMDRNVNGMFDSGEQLLSGVKAELLNGEGLTIAEAQTDEAGRYAFGRLRSGSYSIRFTLGENMLFTDYSGRKGESSVPVTDGRTGITKVFELAMGERNADMHIGAILPGRIGDTVWFDTDGNGLQDYKEPLIPGAELTLLRVSANGTLEETARTTSDAYGYYAFTSLRPGVYVLRYDAQMGDTLTFSFGAPLGEIDSDIDPDTLMSAEIMLESGQTLRNIDVGLTEHEAR